MAGWPGLPPLRHGRQRHQAADRRRQGGQAPSPDRRYGSASERSAGSSSRSKSGPFSSMAVSRFTRCYRPSTCFAARKRAVPRTSYIACSASPTRRLGFSPIASVRPCGPASWPQWAAQAASSKSDETYIGRLEGVPKQKHGGSAQEHGADACGARRRLPAASISTASAIADVIADRARERAVAKARFMTDEGQALLAASARNLPNMVRSSTPPTNTFATRGPTSTPTRSKATIRFSNAA